MNRPMGEILRDVRSTAFCRGVIEELAYAAECMMFELVLAHEYADDPAQQAKVIAEAVENNRISE